MKFSLESDLAAKYGLVEAILLDYLAKWLRYNASKGNAYNYRDGRYWVYDSTPGLSKKMSGAVSQPTLFRSIKKLIDSGLIERTNKYNAKPYDKTFWYSLTEKGWSEIAKAEGGDLIQNEYTPIQNEQGPIQNEYTPIQNEYIPIQNEYTPIQNELTIPNLSPINPPISLPIDRRDIGGEEKPNFQKTIQGQIIPKKIPLEVQQRLDYFIKNFRPFKNVNEAEEIYQIAASSTNEEFTYAVDAAVGKAKYKPWRYIETVIKNYRETKAEEEAPAAKKPRKKKGSQDLQTSYENVMKILEESGDFDE